MRLNVLLVLLLGSLVTGCARVSSLSTLSADGSFTRKVTYTVNASPEMTEQKPADPNKLFNIPKDGGGVKVSHTTDAKGVQTVTAERTVAVGAPPLQDITLLDDKGETMATSTVLVKKLGDGRLEYTESLHWAGPRKSDTKVQSEQLRGAVKKALPAEYQKTDVIDTVTHKALIGAVHVIFGPSEPVFADILLNHDGSERRVSRLLLDAFSLALHESIAEMSPDQCNASAKSIVLAFGLDQMNPDVTPPDPSKPSDKSSMNDMTPLFFDVAFPGKVVETNGILDPVTGRVYWSLFVAALEIEDVTLKLTVQP